VIDVPRSRDSYTVSSFGRRPDAPFEVSLTTSLMVAPADRRYSLLAGVEDREEPIAPQI
jgi:hypothetical protein